jgi:hypothetical protein
VTDSHGNPYESPDPYENPYEAPATFVEGIQSGKIEDLRSVAVYQKGIIVCILIQLMMFLGLFMVPSDIAGMIWIAAVPIGVASTILIVLLAIKVYGTGIGILLGILAFVPCMGLLILLMVNGKATRILRRNGHQVGFLGANLSQFP